MTDRGHAEEMWMVQLPDGELRAWNVDELDDAYQRDAVGLSTLVRRKNDITWQSLGELIAESDETIVFTKKIDPPRVVGTRPLVNDEPLEGTLVMAVRPMP